ncbi:hypothetical protein V6N11_048783 [Hibiscus sabdariffa]|uniref:Uncharacterized protein n=1 Tax=Hibiscus sabdariffa TaxID=183260 RepID=A0ABR2PWB0_9ROSI
MATTSNTSRRFQPVSATFMAMVMLFLFSVVPAMADDEVIKQTNMTVYFQDYSAGPNATSLPMVGFPGKLWSYTDFGTFVMTDDLVTEGPELTSAVVGRGQGISMTITFLVVITVHRSLLTFSSFYLDPVVYSQLFALLTMAEALVSGVFERLTSISLQVAENGVGLVVGVNEEVQKIGSTLRTIRAVLADAEKRQVKEHAVKLWLHNLQNVAYDIEDLLDGWNTAILRSQMEESRSSSSSTFSVSRLAPSGNSIPRLVGRRNIAVKIKELNERLQVIAKEKDDFAFNVNLTRNNDVEPERPKTTCFIDVSEIRGRDQDKNTIVSMLLSESSAQERDPFDEMRVAKAILEALTGTPSSFGELNTVLEKIHESIAGKRFLLVLDDVWTEDERKWQSFKYCLNSGAAPGSRILVTTRKENVAALLGCTKLFHLGSLSEEECWSLFSHIAFSGRNDRERWSLADIGKKIADKLACNGLEVQRAEWCHENARHVRVILDNEQAAIPISLYNAKKLRSLIVDSVWREIKDWSICPRHCDLCNLQTLNVRLCSILKKLPFGIERLINLRHLQNTETYGCAFMGCGLKKLTLLQTLEEFVVVSDRSIIYLPELVPEDLDSSSLGDLGSFAKLRGNLKIIGLGDVIRRTDAEEAELWKKTDLRNLTLSFISKCKDRRFLPELEASVLEALRAPPYLEYLNINHMNGPTTFPGWMVSLTMLRRVTLWACLNWKTLPPMWKLPVLEHLEIWEMKNVKEVGQEFMGPEIEKGQASSSSDNNNIAFPSLKHLKFQLMEEWQEWTYGNLLITMPLLCSLRITSCLKLKSLPRQLLQKTTLQVLDITDCSILKECCSRNRTGGGTGPTSLISLPSQLMVKTCKEKGIDQTLHGLKALV